MESVILDRIRTVLLIVCATCLLWLCWNRDNAGMTAYGQSAVRSDVPKTPKILEAQEFRLVDEENHVRAVLTLHPGKKADPRYENKPGLYLYKENGQLGVRLAMDDERGSLSLHDDAGRPCVAIGVSKLQPSSHQGGFMTITDSDKEGANLGVWIDYGKGTGPASSLKLFSGSARKLLWEPKF